MTSAKDDRKTAPVVLSFAGSLAVALAIFLLGAAAIFYTGVDNSEFHTMLDTSVVLTGLLICLLLWDVSARTGLSLSLFLAIAFGALVLGELLHTLAALGWLSIADGTGPTEVQWRARTWGPPAHLLAIGVGAAFLLRGRSRDIGWMLTLGLLVFALALYALFFAFPRYSAPAVFGITRPTLVLVPVIWAVNGVLYWKHRTESEITRAVASTAIILAIAHIAMLYSHAPNDPAAMVAHLGEFVGDAFFLFCLTQIDAADTARRMLAERELRALNRELDVRVQGKTEELQTTNEALKAEITERRRNVDLLQAVTENTQAVIYVKALDGRYLMVNQRYCDIFQLTREMVVGKTDYDLFSKEAADAFRAMDERVAQAAYALTEEEAAPHHDGLHNYISVKSPLRDETGKPFAIFGISTDVTELKRVEQALAESEERARLIVETALDAAVSINAAGEITDWSPQAETTFGWLRSEVQGRDLAELIMPEPYRARHKEGLIRYFETGEAQFLNRRVEISALRRSGQEFPIELAITPIRVGGAVTFSGFIRDISERKTAETKLQTQLERLRLLDQITRAIGQRQDLQSIYQVVVRSLEDRLPADFVCIGSYDRLKQIVTVRHVGTKSRALGQELGMMEQAEVAIDQNGLSQCVAGGLVYEPNIAELDYPFPRRLAEEGLRSVVIAPLTVEAEVSGVLVVARLVESTFSSTDCEFLKQLGVHIALASHQAQLRQSLENAYEDLKQSQQAAMQQERLRALGQMASGIAHDINNAISPVAVYNQSLLERELDLSPRTRDHLELVGRVIKDVSVTVARMRDFYRRGDSDNDTEALDLNELVPQVVELTRARWSDIPQRRGVVINVVTQLEQNLPLVIGNATELREVATNLIFNAVDAMPDGGTITIKTAALNRGSRSDARVLFEIGDSGIGMDETTRRRCIEPFFTTKGERGTGLGLAMVYGAAQRHRAHFDIDSAPGKGTRIQLQLPAAAKARKRGDRVVDRSRIPPMRLLVVDDDPSVLQSTQIVLELDGHTVTAADGGETGIDILRAAKEAGGGFDAVITDLGMPYTDGNQVAHIAKELYPAMPVILLTGWGGRLGGRDENATYIDHALPKPLELDDLREVLLRCSQGKS